MTDKAREDQETNSFKVRPCDYDVYISHASEDSDLVRSLWGALSSQGINCWSYEKSLKEGEEWDQQIREAIDRSRICLLVLSKSSEPSEPWLSREWSLIQSSAWKRDDLIVIPILVDRVKPPPFLRRWQSLKCNRKKPNVGELATEVLEILVSEHPNQEKESEKEWDDAAKRFRKIQRAIRFSGHVSDKAKKNETPDD